MSFGIASLNVVAQIAVPFAFAACLALRWIYLRVVRRTMLRDTVAAADDLAFIPASSSLTSPPSRPLEIVNAPPPTADAVRTTRSGPFAAVGVHGIASVVYAVTMTLVWAWVADSGYSWQGVLLFSSFFIWPLVIVIGLVASLSWRVIPIVVLTYAVLFLAGSLWLTEGTGITLDQIVHNWWNVNGMGTMLVLAFLARPIRAMGPIMVALMMATTAGVFGMADLLTDESTLLWVATLATELGFSGYGGGIAVALIAFGFAATTAGIVAYFALRGIGQLYQAQWISDQSIQTGAVWLIFAIVHAPAQQPLAGFAAFALYELVARVGSHMVQPHDPSAGRPCQLLLLRVFALGTRSEELFRNFSSLWRYIGSVRLIAGPDLANTTVEPHELLDFIAGRLQRRFISSGAMLEKRLTESELRRDVDGRFRVSSFFCHADTWQGVLRRLTRESDLVLMDLRGFTSANQGCIFEIHELLEAVDLERLLLVVDDTTDEALLTSTLHSGWAAISAASPNRSNPCPRVRLHRLDQAGGAAARLVASLAGMYRRVVVPADKSRAADISAGPRALAKPAAI